MRRLLLSMLAVMTLVSCDSESVPETAPTTTRSTETTIPAPSTTVVGPTTTVVGSTTTTAGPALPESEGGIYLFFEGYPVEPGPYLAVVSREGVTDLEGALAALLDGPDEVEASMGLSSTIPEGTRLLGVEVIEDVAYVDLSAEFESGGGSLSMMGRVAQIVYTATRFDGVDSVRFLLEGAPLDVLGGEGLIIDQPQTRASWADLTPPILVEEPMWGSTRGNHMTFAGIAGLESGTVSFVVVDGDGLIIHEGEISGAPGETVDFSEPVTLDDIPHPGAGSIIAWEWAPDGSQRHVVEYPLILVAQG